MRAPQGRPRHRCLAACKRLISIRSPARGSVADLESAASRTCLIAAASPQIEGLTTSLPRRARRRACRGSCASPSANLKRVWECYVLRSVRDRTWSHRISALCKVENRWPLRLKLRSTLPASGLLAGRGGSSRSGPSRMTRTPRMAAPRSVAAGVESRFRCVSLQLTRAGCGLQA
jgi:hypothetical protein